METDIYASYGINMANIVVAGALLYLLCVVLSLLFVLLLLLLFSLSDRFYFI